MLTRNRSQYIIIPGLFIALSFFLSECDEKVHTPSYPQIKSLPVSDITPGNAKFNAELYSLGTELITEYGFVWDSRPNPSLLYNNRIFLGIPSGVGIYSAEIKTTLIEGSEYTVKPFVKTEDHIVYGTPVSFISLGSMAPVISDFKPDSAVWNDTLQVIGNNFSWDPHQNSVKLNGIQCTIISSTDTNIFVRIPNSLNVHESSLTVDLAGNTANFLQKKFRLILPVLMDFYPKQAAWGDTLNIKGRNLRVLTFMGTSFKLGSISCQFVKELTDSVVKIRIPYNINIVNSPLNINLNGFLLQGKQDFELLPPFFSFAPKAGTWGDTITMTGRFNTIPAFNTILFSNIQATILSVTPTTLITKVPNRLSEIESRFIYKVSPFEIASSDLFTLLPPVINSFAPASGPSGASVTIKGKYFGFNPPIVKFGESAATVKSFNDSAIVVKVPPGGFGPVSIRVTVNQQSIASNNEFDITNPRIDNIYPLSGTFKDEITIEGVNLIPTSGSTTVYFNQSEAAIKSLTANSIVVLVPLSIDSIPTSIIVNVGLNSANSIQKFSLLPPEIYYISPATIVGGEEIVINGLNFHPDISQNKVFLDFCQLVIKSTTNSQIIATVPFNLPRGNLKVNVITGGYSRYASQTFSFNSKWRRIPSPQIPTNYNDIFYIGISIYGESIKDIGYLASVASDATYSFNPLDDSWINLGIHHPNWFRKRKMGEIVCKDTLYLIGGPGDNNNKLMYAFDPMNNKWREFDMPYMNAVVAFYLNDKIYFGLDYFFPFRSKFWECDPGNNYLCTEKGAFVNSPEYSFSTYFSIYNKGYVVFSNNQVWQFDPDLLAWVRKSDFPGIPRELAVSFVLNGYAYMGTGKTSNGLPLDDFWKYDTLSDSWTLVSYMPNPRFSAVALTINNKAYVGFGTQARLEPDLYDFYEFDPDYPLK